MEQTITFTIPDLPYEFTLPIKKDLTLDDLTITTSPEVAPDSDK